MGSFVNSYARCIINKSLIARHFDFCATILISSCKTAINRLQIQQNRAMRAILHCGWYTQVRTMLDTMCFMSINERIEYITPIFIFKMKMSLMPKNIMPENKIC